MLFKFKSNATGDLIMLEPNGRQVLGIIGKDATPQGIIQVATMDAAILALTAAVDKEEADNKAAVALAKSEGKSVPQEPEVSLRQRAMPFIDMLKRCRAEEQDITWGV